MPRILIDGRRAQGSRAGVGHYTKSVIAHWPHPAEIEVLVDVDREPEDFPGVATRGLKGGVIWNLRAAWLARRTRALYFSPESFIVPLLLGRRALITVHDLTALDIPDAQTRKNVVVGRFLLKATLRRVGAIIVPTDAVQRDLARHFPEVAAKSHVVPEGIREFAATDEPAALAAVTPLTPYVLYVGTIEPRKNVLALVEAFLRAAPAEWNLVLAGQVGWLSDPDRERFSQLAADPHVHHLGYVPDAWLGTLFERARLFAYVSESEGFGLPVAEAMAAGVTVIHSDDPALLEVAGGAGIVVRRAHLADDLRASLTAATALDDAAIAAHVAAGRAASARFDWRVAASEADRIVKSLL